MILRPYQITDKAACLKLFDSNTPQYFGANERDDFAGFLDNPDCTYFVVEDDQGEVIGSGGYYINSETLLAGICWGMVANHLHKTGVGKFLMRERLKRMCEEARGGQLIYVYNQTSQHTAGFYEKFGFTTVKITENAFAPGLHRYEMLLILNDANCNQH